MEPSAASWGVIAHVQSIGIYDDLHFRHGPSYNDVVQEPRFCYHEGAVPGKLVDEGHLQPQDFTAMFTPIKTQVKVIGHRGLLAVALLSVTMGGCGLQSEQEALRSVQPKADSTVDQDVVARQSAVAEIPLDDPSVAELPKRTEPVIETPGDPSPVESTDKPIAGPIQKKKFRDEQLHKNATLLMLAMEPDIRALELVKFVRAYLSVEQKQAAVKLILQYDETYQDLKKRRAAILENAQDGNNVAQQLLEIKQEMAVFSESMRVKVLQEILTEEQRQQRQLNRRASGKL